MGSATTTYSLHVLRAHGLPTSSFPKGLRSYVKIHVGDFSASTQIHQQGGDPVWEEEFVIPVTDPSSTLLLQVKHSKRFRFLSQSNPCLGAIKTDIRDLLQWILEPEISLALRDPSGNDDGQDRGSIIIRFVAYTATPHVRQYGFTVLSDGEDEMGGPIVDIILVHGLGGHPLRTWTKTVQKSDRNDHCGRDIFWPNDLLPKKITNARVLTYGYESDVLRVLSKTNQPNIPHLAMEMLSALEAERRQDPGRPIIFIAHSLGGILVKDALHKSATVAAHQKHLEHIYKSTCGVVFFGTPHRGTNWAALSKAIHTLTLRHVDTGRLDTFNPDSETLDRITEEFAIMLKDNAFKTHSFYETKEIIGVSGLSGKIVDYPSAIIDEAPEVSEGIDADHIEMCKFDGMDDENFRKLLMAVQGYVDEIARRAMPESVNDTPISRLSAHFVGREKEVKFLQDALSKVQNGRPSCCVVCGMPGIGKSQLVLHYAKISFDEDRYPYIFWISAANVDRLIHGLTKLLDIVRHPDRYLRDQDAKLMATRQWLENTHRDWLLVIDNVDGSTLPFLQAHLPDRNSRGHILFTARATNVAEALMTLIGIQGPTLQLHPLELRDSANLLLQDSVNIETVTPSSLTHAEKLVKALGFLPLAITQAASYMKQTCTTLDEMHESYEGSERIELIEWENTLTTYEERSIATTFTKQFNQLKDESREIDNLFKFLSFLDPKNIPCAMIIEGAEEWLYPRHPLQDTLPQPESDSPIFLEFRSLVALIRSPVRFTTSLEKLQALSLVEYRSDVSKSLWMHDLIRFIKQEEVKKEATYQEWLRSSISLVCGAFRQITDPESPQRWVQCEAFIPHLRSLNRWWDSVCGMNVELIWANEGIAAYVESRGRYDEAEELRKQILEACKLKLGWEHKFTLRAMDNLALNYHSQGRYDEAESLHKQALAAREKQSGVDHLDTLTSVNNLALIYHSQGRYDEAEPLHKQVLAIRERLLGVDHPDTLTAVNNLAFLFRSQGQYNDAEVLYQRSLAGFEHYLGPDHPDTLSSMSSLAGVHALQGRYADAEVLFKRAVEGFEKTLGPLHLSTLGLANNLAGVYNSQGRYDDAEKLYKRALAGFEEHLGADHPDTLRSKNNLAGVYGSQGRYDEAGALYERALASFEEHLGADHPSTLNSASNLAAVYHSQGRYDEANALYKRVLAGRQEHLGAHHPDTLRSMSNLAGLYDSQGQHDDAEELYKRVLVNFENYLGADHPSTLTSMNNLACVYDSQGRPDEAEELFKRALSSEQKLLGADHPSTLASMNNLARVYQSQGRYGEAEELFKRALVVKEKGLGADHPSTLTSMNNLACVYDSQGRLDEAEELFKRALSSEQKLLSADHPSTLASIDNLARVYKSQGRYGEAEELLKRTLAIKKKDLRADHPSTPTSMNSLPFTRPQLARTSQ